LYGGKYERFSWLGKKETGKLLRIEVGRNVKEDPAQGIEGKPEDHEPRGNPE
jgi:hypothetical protein